MRLSLFDVLAMLVILLVGNIRIGSMVAIPAGALLVLAWARLSHTPWRAIGYVRPKNWAVAVAGGVLFGIVLKLVLKAIVMPLLGAPPINQAYHWVAGNTAALVPMLFLMIIVAGWGEETLYRGWMFERLGKLLGTSVWARTSIVVLTSVLFALPHSVDQGIAGAEQALMTGLVFGTIFALTGRIFLLMVLHAAFDVTALAMIYWNFETAVAHFFFK
jgi:uncharacterized protein